VVRETEKTLVENTGGRAVSKKLLVVSTTVLALTVALLVQTHAQNRVTSVPSGGTPVVPDSQVNGPVPRLPDGHPDLSGPWLGGGSNADIEREGGLKPGELPLLPWAKELRDKRKEQDEPYVACTPMSVPRINPVPMEDGLQPDSERRHGDLHPARARRRRSASRRVHGRPQASR
jgi:hypothetical protein